MVVAIVAGVLVASGVTARLGGAVDLPDLPSLIDNWNKRTEVGARERDNVRSRSAGRNKRMTSDENER